MKQAVVLGALLLCTLAISADPPLGKEDAENCEDGLSCTATLRMETDNNRTRLIAGYTITATQNGTNVGDATKKSIEKNTAFKYRELAEELLEKLEADVTSRKCDNRVDLVALSIGESAMKLTRSCIQTGTNSCMQESPVLICGSNTTSAPVTVPWELVLPSNETTFDKEGSNFDIFSALLRHTELESLLVTASEITLLLPNDEAIARAAHYMGVYRGDLEDEEAVFKALTTITDKGIMVKGDLLSNVEVLKLVLGYHILKGQHPIQRWDSGLPRLFTSSVFLPVLSLGNKEITDESPATPNSKIIQHGLKVEGGVVVHVLNMALVPIDQTAEDMSPFECKKKDRIEASMEPTSTPSL